MWIVVLSGMFGAWAYLILPRRLSLLRGGGTRSDLFAQLLELDRQIRDLADRAGGTDCRHRDDQRGGTHRDRRRRDRAAVLARCLHVHPQRGREAAPNADQRALIGQLAQRTPRADKRQEEPRCCRRRWCWPVAASRCCG